MVNIILFNPQRSLDEKANNDFFKREEWESKCSMCSQKFLRECTGFQVSAYRGNRQAWKEFALQAWNNNSQEYLGEMSFRCVQSGAEISG